MNRKSLVASFGLVACLAAALSAQAPSSNGKLDQKAVQSNRVKVIGCVEGDSDGEDRLRKGPLIREPFVRPRRRPSQGPRRPRGRNHRRHQRRETEQQRWAQFGNRLGEA